MYPVRSAGTGLACHQRGADGRFIEHGKHHVVPPGQRPTARNHMPTSIHADGLELPDSTDQLEVADMLILVDKDAVNAVI